MSVLNFTAALAQLCRLIQGKHEPHRNSFPADRQPSQAITNSVSSSDSVPTNHVRTRFLGRQWDFWAARIALISASVVLCYTLSPFGFHGLPAAGLGFLVAMVILLAELRLRRAEISGLMGGAVGAVLGLLAALLITLVISRTAEPEPTKSFFEFTSLFALGYLGLVIGSHKGPSLHHVPLPNSVEVSAASSVAAVSNAISAVNAGANGLKLLDTSVLIDGSIADICDTHFLDGAVAVPRFVLHELQLVADSSDSLKRQRGRRGLEVLQRMQKMRGLEIRRARRGHQPLFRGRSKTDGTGPSHVLENRHHRL